MSDVHAFDRIAWVANQAGNEELEKAFQKRIEPDGSLPEEKELRRQMLRDRLNESQPRD